MSRPRSRSPRYRQFPWEEPSFDSYKTLAGLEREQMDRNLRPREEHEERRTGYLREDMYPGGDRRSPRFSDDRHFMRQRHPNQEFYCTPSPQRDMRGYDDRRLSPLHDRGGDGDRCRGGFREHSKSFESRRRSPHSPVRFARERLPPIPRSHSDHQQREPEDWRRGEQSRGRGRFRDLSPSAKLNDQKGEAYRERRNTQGPNRDRQGEELHHERTPPFKSQRREMDDGNHLGYRNEEDFGKHRYSMDTPKDGIRGDFQESRVDSQHSVPLVIEHDHGAHGRGSSRWEEFGDRRDLDPDFNRQRSPRRLDSSQEHFRASESRLEDQEDKRGRHFQENWRDRRRSPTPKDRPNPMRYINREGHMIHRGRGVPHPMRGRVSRGQGGRTGPHRNPPRLTNFSRGYQDLSREEQKPEYQPPKEDCYNCPNEGEPEWAEENRHQLWKHDRPGNLDQDPLKIDLDPKMPRQRVQGWNSQKNTTVLTEETLTIKVDMSQPINQNSSPCYSSDRQLSLDLVNVGRQRLDFLPMLEHSGTYRETAVHTGTFAQEIITLVHHVKEQYFRDDGITLNERFSAPQKSSYTGDEVEELTLDERFRTNRGFNLNTNLPLDDEEPLFFRTGSLQPVRGPGDLRHDLERRRQERLEGVKVTISGNTMSQCSPGPVSEPCLEYGDKDEMALMEEEGFSNWPEEQSRRREGNMEPRRGVSYRLNSNVQRRNNRFGSRLGPMRRLNNHSAGANW